MKAIQTLDVDTLKKLAEKEAPVCITLTMPCVVAGDQQPQNMIRFKNLCQEAEKKLEKIGFSEGEAKTFLRPLAPLDHNETFWSHQKEGFLACLSEGFTGIYMLPFEIGINAIVDRHFYLRPVIPYMQHEKSAALFLLGIKQPALVFFSSRDDKIDILHPPKPYTSFESFMETFEPEKALQFRSQPSGENNDATGPGFHGFGVGGDKAEKESHLTEYLKQVENWVYETLAHRGIESVFWVTDAHNEGLYKKAMRDSHPDLKFLARKNPHSKDIKTWVKEAQTALQGSGKVPDQDVISLYQRRKEKEHDSVKETLPEILAAAHNKRIDTLVLQARPHDYKWGRFNPETRHVTYQKKGEEESGAGDELVNLAVIKTFLNGGRIVELSEAKAQGVLKQEPYAAICRW